MLSATSSTSDSAPASTRAPASACVLTTSNSCAESRPGLSRIESGIAILPTSCSGAAWRMAVEVGGRDERRARAQVERVEQLAQLGLRRTEGDDHVGPAGERGVRGGLGVGRDGDLRGAGGEPRSQGARRVALPAPDEDAGPRQRVVHNRASWRSRQTRGSGARSRATASKSASGAAGWAWSTAPGTKLLGADAVAV